MPEMQAAGRSCRGANEVDGEKEAEAVEAAVNRPGGSELARAPMLWPCPCCGGQADYRYARGLDVFAVCVRCGLRTEDAPNPLAAGELWNRRTTEGARFVTLQELLNSDFHYEGEGGGAAVWIETRDGGIRAALLVGGIDMGELSVVEYDAAGIVRKWGREEIAAEGELYRIWNWCPSDGDRARAEWTAETWRPWGALKDINKTEG